jgi:hypothetical protein
MGCVVVVLPLYTARLLNMIMGEQFAIIMGDPILTRNWLHHSIRFIISSDVTIETVTYNYVMGP